MQKPGPVTKLILLVIALVVVIGFAFEHYQRSMARAEADRIISSQQPPTHKQIHKIPNVLLRTKSWTRDGTERDYQRVVQLYQMRDKMLRAMASRHLARYPLWSGEWPSSCYLSSDPNAGYVIQNLKDMVKKTSTKTR